MPVVPDALESSSLDVADFEVENVDVPAAAGLSIVSFNFFKFFNFFFCKKIILFQK